MVYDGRMRDFKRLEVWRRSFSLSVSLDREVNGFDARHRFGLGDQLTRAALSIPANIAEGAGRESVREFRRYLTIALARRPKSRIICCSQASSACSPMRRDICGS